jgi:ribosomal-protein-alanine N-acetyltransferase
MRVTRTLDVGQALEVAGVSLRLVGAGTDARIAVDAPPGVSLREDAPGLPVHFRWMCPSDLPEVAAIERAGSDRPWSEDEIDLARRAGRRVSLVALAEGRIVGFLIYELRPRSLGVVRLAVGPEARRMGVGSQMVDRLVGRLDDPSLGRGRTRIDLVVPETHLGAQLFFRARGFVAVAVLHGHFPGEDAYALRYRLDGQGPGCGPAVLPLAPRPPRGKESA